MILTHLPDLGSWSMSPSRLSDSGTRSIACSELIAPPDRRCRWAAPILFGIVPANTLRILSSASLVNHRFRSGRAESAERVPSGLAVPRCARQMPSTSEGWGDDFAARAPRHLRSCANPVRLDVAIHE